MKLLIVANNQKDWRWDKKIRPLKEWFRDLDVDLIHTSFKDIPFTPLNNGKEIDKKWYDKNVLPLAKGYDMVLFSVSMKQWKGGAVRGGSIDGKPQKLQLGADETGTYEYNGIKHAGGRWFNIARHEVTHAWYKILKIKDNTHYWWDKGQLEETLKELKPMYKYFKASEIVGLKSELVSMLDKTRGIAGIPFIINSGLRSESQNEAAGGVEDSAHLRGYAVDIKCLDSSSRWKIVNAAIQVGFTRIGIAKTFIHLDCDKSKSQEVIWLY